MPHGHTPSKLKTPTPEAYIVGRWFTAARRQALLATLSPEAWHTLSAILSFTSRDGQRRLTIEQLALALALPRDTARARLDALAEVQWHDQPLLTLERDSDGEVVGATLASLDLFARIVPEDADATSSHEDAVGAPEAPDPRLVADLEAAGLDTAQIERLTRQFPHDRLRRQLDWLPARQAHNPAAMLVRAIEQDWGPPRGAA
jgi:hypothetical protein